MPFDGERLAVCHGDSQINQYRIKHFSLLMVSQLKVCQVVAIRPKCYTSYPKIQIPPTCHMIIEDLGARST